MIVRWMLVLFTLSLSNAGAQAASFVVNSATALPSPVQIGQTLKMVGSVSASQNASNYMIGLFVYDVTTSTVTAYQAFTALNFVVGTPIIEEFDWTVPGGTSLTDSYEFGVAVFNSNSVYQNAEYIVPFTIVGGSPPPVNLEVPVISGTAQVGTVLSSSTGTWAGAPSSFAYQWAGNSTPITGAVASTYTPAVSDVGHTLTVAVTATGTGGTATATSAATAPMASASGGPAGPNWYTNGYPTPQYTCLTNYYVSTAGSDFNAGTLASPWLTIAHGWTSAGPAVCINVIGPGNYGQTASLNLSRGGNANSATGYAVLRAVNSSGAYNPAVDASQGIHAGTAPRIYASASLYNLVVPQAGWTIIDGFEIDGNAVTNTGHGISDEANSGHHFIAENNLIHDHGGAGLQLNYTEFLWVYNNVIHDNGIYNIYSTMSGLSFYHASTATGFTPNAADNALPYRIIAAQNLFWHNYNGPSMTKHQDGEAIILDNLADPSRTDPGPYTTPVLIYGNVACFNGGSAWQLNRDQNVTIANNSSYANYLDLANTGTWRAEGMEVLSDNRNNTWVNNILRNITSGTGINSGGGSLGNNKSAAVFWAGGNAPSGDTFTNNIGYPGPSWNNSSSESFATGSGNPRMTVSDPRYTVPGSVPTSSTHVMPCNLRPQAGSPAINAAVSRVFIPSSVTNIGAYGPGALQ